MSLEQLPARTALMVDSLISSSPLENSSYLTLANLSTYCKSNTTIISNGMDLTGHRSLSRTASDNSFLTRTQPIMSRHTTLASMNSGGYNNDMQCSSSNRFLSTVNFKLSQNNNLSNSQANKVDSEHRFPLFKEKSITTVRRNVSSSGLQTTECINNSRIEKSLVDKSVLLSGEFVLDFPSNDHSSQTQIVKRPDKIRDVRSHLSLHHSASMPGLIDSSLKESRSDAPNAKFEKPSPFFLFFRKKNKTSDGRSPSPSVKSHQQNIRRCASNLSFTPQSQTVSQRTTSPSRKGRRSAGQSPVSTRLYLNSVSSNIPCTPSYPPSMCSPTETTSNSPSSTEKFPRYIPRSRSKRRREPRRKNTGRKQVDPNDHLTFEDLPPHPSVLKQPLGKTNSFPCTSINTPSSMNINTSSNNSKRHRSNVISAIRRNSLPDSHANLKIKDSCSERRYGPNDSKVDSSQNLRRKSPESSSKPSENDSQCEMICASHDQDPKSPVLSQSVPSFGADFNLPGADTRVISDAEDFECRPSDMTGPLHLSICGCGFLGMYHLGVISCLTQRSPSFIEQVEKVAGASAGAIMAALLVSCPDKIEQSTKHIQLLAKELRKKPLGPLTPGYNFTRSLRCMLDDILPENAHETAHGKLFVSVTNSDTKKNEMISDFTSRDELIEVLVSSCYVPLYAGIKPAPIRGKKYIDGGLSNNMPVFETGRTITVSPFDRTSEIGPKEGQEADKGGHFITIQNQDIKVSVNNARKSTQAFFPPKRQSLEEYFVRGRYDASRFLIREGLYEISTLSQKKVTLYESSV